MATTTAPQPFRVVREDGEVEREAPDFGTAFIAALPNAGWRIETQYAGAWLPAHLAFAMQVLAARVGDVVETFDGPLTKNSGSWSLEQERQASSVAAEGTPQWAAAIRQHPHETATLTSDGLGAIVAEWCSCGSNGQARYERWSALGREAHGFVCERCRRLTQTG